MLAASPAKGTTPKGRFQPTECGDCETSPGERNRRSSSLTIAPTMTTATAPITLCHRKATSVKRCRPGDRAHAGDQAKERAVAGGSREPDRQMKTPRIEP